MTPLLRLISDLASSISADCDAQEVIVIILLTIQWLTRTAYELLACAGRKKEALGADDMFPLLVNVLANSNIPNIHLIMVWWCHGGLHCAFECIYFFCCIAPN